MCTEKNIDDRKAVLAADVRRQDARAPEVCVKVRGSQSSFREGEDRLDITPNFELKDGLA